MSCIAWESETIFSRTISYCMSESMIQVAVLWQTKDSSTPCSLWSCESFMNINRKSVFTMTWRDDARERHHV